MFCIIGKKDVPLFETTLGVLKKEVPLNQHFYFHSALDIVDEQTFSTTNMFLKTVDKTGEFTIYAFTTASNLKFMLLLDSVKGEDAIKNFFYDVYELVVKNLMNPLYDLNSPINFPIFETRVKTLSSKHLG